MSEKRIKKLNEEVIKQISAGEVIQRPVNCVKELIENSLDAGSTSIQVTLKRSGFDLIKVKDDGCGIAKHDLLSVCERFSTSKLEKIDDLSNIETYGFRGEALFSISCVANITILTKTKDDDIGYQVEYRNGKSINGIKPLAANNGTIITIENLFQNNPLRLNCLKSENTEFNYIADVVMKYAIHCSNSIAFSLRKNDEFVFNTNLGSQTVTNIDLLYGTNIGKNVTSICCKNDDLKFSMTGIISKPNFVCKKFNFILFINDRLVECSVLKKCIENVYLNFLSKGMHPFVYLSMKILPENVDVNVHPSKNEVRYLNEDEINAEISNCITTKLTSANMHSLLGSSIQDFTSLRTPKSKTNLSQTNESPSSTKKSPSKNPSKILRTDPRHRTIEEMISQKNIANSTGKNNFRRVVRLYSIHCLKRNVERSIDFDLQKLLKDSQFIGCVDNGTFIIQSNDKLILVNCEILSKELFYQLYLEEFMNFGSITLKKPLSIQQLYDIYLIKFKDEKKVLDSKLATKLLVHKREMLSDYFALDIDANGDLLGLPLILDGYLPNFNVLPDLIFNLANNVNWKSEQECFDSLGRMLSKFYAYPRNDLTPSECESWKKTIEFVIYPKAKKLLTESGTDYHQKLEPQIDPIIEPRLSEHFKARGRDATSDEQFENDTTKKNKSTAKKAGAVNKKEKELHPKIDGVPQYIKLGEDNDEYIKTMIHLRSKKMRVKQDIMALEGKRLISDAIEAGLRLKAIFFSIEENLVGIKRLSELPQLGVKLYKVFYKDIKLYSPHVTPPGVIGIFERPSPKLISEMHAKRTHHLPLTLIADNIRDPGNLGTLIRASAAAGIDKVICTKGCVDVWESKVIRSGCGAHFRIPIYSNIEWPLMSNYFQDQIIGVYIADSNVHEESDNSRSVSDQLLTSNLSHWQIKVNEETGERMKYDESFEDMNILEKYKNVILKTKPYTDVDYSQSKSLALIIGSEASGSSIEALKFCYDYSGCKVKIPLECGVESLNSAVAASIIMYEIKRQFNKE
ncbi:DNA mismatch repair protein Mlh1-like protein [Dinothrombium tinctorium]|uniref:DNA mismatch repair protein Mlh1-like protein n=1 Tax=Dinothrombium tinctorium TaxID=1965070 RepID=A0A443RQK1_9ACAR|nr:DNA mismatch repair protein Mlh1-like protein [Dinothrombium tinctorium]